MGVYKVHIRCIWVVNNMYITCIWVYISRASSVPIFPIFLNFPYISVFSL